MQAVPAIPLPSAFRCIGLSTTNLFGPRSRHCYGIITLTIGQRPASEVPSGDNIGPDGCASVRRSVPSSVLGGAPYPTAADSAVVEL